MRSSIVFLGAILSRCGEARLSFPGGCELGLKAIDLHLRRCANSAEIREEHGCLLCTAPGGLRGGSSRLRSQASGNGKPAARRRPRQGHNGALTNEARRRLRILRVLKTAAAHTFTARGRKLHRHRRRATPLAAHTPSRRTASPPQHTWPRPPSRAVRCFCVMSTASTFAGFGVWRRALRRDAVRSELLRAPQRLKPVRHHVRTMPYPGFPYGCSGARHDHGGGGGRHQYFCREHF